MKNLKDSKAEILNILNEQRRNPADFLGFTNSLIELGIVRFGLDSFNNQMSFYSKSDLVHEVVRSELEENKAKSPWVLGDTLNSSALQKALSEFDAGRMSPIDFHREIFSAGVVYCQVYLIHRKIYYMGQDGQFYLEQY